MAAPLRLARHQAAASPASSPACARRTCRSGSGGVGTSERGELLDQALDPLRVGLLVDAVERRDAASLAAARRPARWCRIISCSISPWASVWSTELGARPPRRRRRTRTRARRSRSRARRPAPARRSAAAARRARASGPRPRAGGELAAGEELVELVVVEPRVGADAAAVEARRPRLAVAAERDLGGDREAVDARSQAAGVVAEQRSGASARPCPARRCCRRAAAPPRRARRPGRTWAATSAMWIQSRMPSASSAAETASSKSRAVAGSTVKVARSGQVAPLGRSSRARRGRRVAAPRPRAGREAPAHPAIPEQGGDHVAGALRPSPERRSALAPPAPSRPARSRRPHVHRAAASAACGPRSNSGSATGKRPRAPRCDRRPSARRAPRAHLFSTAAFSARTASALLRAPRPRRRPGSSTARTSGLIPLPSERGPVGGQVLADRQVERAAGRRGG